MARDAIGLCVLGITLGMQIYLHSFWFKGHSQERSKMLNRIFKVFFWAASAILLGLVVRYSFLQYQLWKAHPFSQLFLPPNRPWSYFLGYVTSHFIGPLAIAVAAGILGRIAAYWLNRRYGERFFEREEPVLFSLGILCVGYPAFIFYILFLAAVAVLWSALYQVVKKERAPLYFLWLPTAIIAILIVHYYVPSVLLAKFNL